MRYRSFKPIVSPCGLTAVPPWKAAGFGDGTGDCASKVTDEDAAFWATAHGRDKSSKEAATREDRSKTTLNKRNYEDSNENAGPLKSRR